MKKTKLREASAMCFFLSHVGSRLESRGVMFGKVKKSCRVGREWGKEWEDGHDQNMSNTVIRMTQ